MEQIGWFAVSVLCAGPLAAVLTHGFVADKPYKLMEPQFLFRALGLVCVAIVLACVEVSRRLFRRRPFAIPFASTLMTAVASVVVCAGIFGVAAASTGYWQGDFGWAAAIEELVEEAALVSAVMLPLAALVSAAGWAWARAE